MSHNIVEVDTEVVLMYNVVSSRNLYSLLCIIHSCAHKMSDYIRILLPLEKTLNSFIRVKRTINKNVGTVFGSWESPGSLLGVSWESPGSLLGVSWESNWQYLGSVFGCYCESPGYLPGVDSPGCFLEAACLLGACLIS
jgi:hypothetical protein